MNGDGFGLPLPLSAFAARPRAFALRAGAATRTLLAGRFGLLGVQELAADLDAWRISGRISGRISDGVAVEGRFSARVVQACAVSGVPVETVIEQPVAARFLSRLPDAAATEVELAEEDLDVLPLVGGVVDLGELVAQSLFLALDPYPLAADAVVEEARLLLARESDMPDAVAPRPVSPFAGLKRH